MSKNKNTVRSSTDKANDTQFEQNVHLEFNELTSFGGTSLGEYSSNDSILQQHNANYHKDVPTVQSAIETVSGLAKLPINSVYTSTVYRDFNTNINQIDEIVISFTGGSGDSLTTEYLVVYMYGVVFEIPLNEDNSGRNISDIAALTETALIASGLFTSVGYILIDTGEFPTATITVTHKGIDNKIPGYVKNEANNNEANFGNLNMSGSVLSTAGSDSLFGYGSWTYLGYEASKTLINGESETGQLYYFRRDS